MRASSSALETSLAHVRDFDAEVEGLEGVRPAGFLESSYLYASVDVELVRLLAKLPISTRHPLLSRIVQASTPAQIGADSSPMLAAIASAGRVELSVRPVALSCDSKLGYAEPADDERVQLWGQHLRVTIPLDHEELDALARRTASKPLVAGLWSILGIADQVRDSRLCPWGIKTCRRTEDRVGLLTQSDSALHLDLFIKFDKAPWPRCTRQITREFKSLAAVLAEVPSVEFTGGDLTGELAIYVNGPQVRALYKDEARALLARSERVFDPQREAELSQRIAALEPVIAPAFEGVTLELRRGTSPAKLQFEDASERSYIVGRARWLPGPGYRSNVEEARDEKVAALNSLSLRALCGDASFCGHVRGPAGRGDRVSDHVQGYESLEPIKLLHRNEPQLARISLLLETWPNVLRTMETFSTTLEHGARKQVREQLEGAYHSTSEFGLWIYDPDQQKKRRSGERLTYDWGLYAHAGGGAYVELEQLMRPPFAPSPQEPQGIDAKYRTLAQPLSWAHGYLYLLNQGSGMELAAKAKVGEYWGTSEQREPRSGWLILANSWREVHDALQLETSPEGARAEFFAHSVWEGLDALASVPSDAELLDPLLRSLSFLEPLLSAHSLLLRVPEPTLEAPFSLEIFILQHEVRK